jgi:uncharacterized protein
MRSVALLRLPALGPLVRRTAIAVRQAMQDDSSGHDWWHVRRVWITADRIARTEPSCHPGVVSLGALLHDLGDWKFHGGDVEAAPRAAGRLLRRLGAPPEIVGRVQALCREVSFKGAGVPDRPGSIECRIVQDADRLDAIGAIGIARAFAYGGSRNRAIYEPGRAPVKHRSFVAYRRSRGHTINHFHEKLLLLKDRLHTREARRLARRRHAFMEAFLKRFHEEWGGE